MTKLSETQRQYFIKRTKQTINEVVEKLKKASASKMEKLVKEKYGTYLKKLGIEQKLKKLEKLENETNELQDELVAIARRITGKSRYGIGSSYEDINEAIKDQCRIDVEEYFHNNIPEGKKIAELEDKRNRAIDYIYGLSTNSEIIQGVNAILNGSGLKLGAEIKKQLK